MQAQLLDEASMQKQADYNGSQKPEAHSGSAEEELRSVCARSSIGHGQDACIIKDTSNSLTRHCNQRHHMCHVLFDSDISGS